MDMKKILILLAGMISLASVARAADPGVITEREDVPSLISSVRFETALDFCGEPVPLDSQEVRERLEKEMLLTLADRPQVILWLKRSRRFLPIIEKELESSGLPQDLKYVAIAESALRPHAGSPAGAIGFWQFMQNTGRRYGLTVNKEFDERRSIFKSTQAAISYLKDLYAEFQSWTLAAAAFNMGEEGLRAEILLQEVNDYYRLYLPLETQRYIFRIISAKLILSDPEKYGFRMTETDYYPPLAFDRIVVQCDQRTPLRVVAQAADTHFKRIKDLNPDIRGHYLAAGRHEILVPGGSGVGFQKRYEKILASWRKEPDQHVYIVKKGDNLSSIAELFQVPLPALLIWNNLDLRKPIHPGDRLVIHKQISEPVENDGE